MRALLDVNMLLAAFDAGHIHHRLVLDWWSENAHAGWASCSLTQNGFLRIVSQRSYARPVALASAIAVLRRQINDSDHEFWSDHVSILDAEVVDHSRLLTPRRISDIHILALAVKNGGRLVTLDRGIQRAAVRGAEEAHLHVLV